MDSNLQNNIRVFIESGSNSMKFSVAEIDLWPPKPLMEIEKITRLGEGVAVENRLHPDAIQRVLDILENGYDCQRSKRKKGTIERCKKAGKKIHKVVVVDSPQYWDDTEVWLITHVGVIQ